MSPRRIPALLLLAAAAWHATVFGSVAFSRLTFPFEVEFLEGLTIDYARAIADGVNLYAPPWLHGAPNWYPPLQYLVCLPPLWLSGWHLWAARLVSIASVVGAMVLGARLLRRLGGTWAAVAAAVAVALAYYPDTLYWYDLARVDALQVVLLIAGMVVLSREGARPRSPAIALAALLLAAAAFTKQTAAIVCLGPLAFFLIDREPRKAARLALWLAALGTLGFGLLLFAYGRPALILLWAPSGHYRNLAGGARAFAAFAWTMLPLLGLALVGLRGSAGSRRGRVLRLWLTTFAFAAAIGFLTMCKIGGQTNSSMPAIFLLAVCVGLSLDRVVRATRDSLAEVWIPVALALFLLAAFQRDYLRWIPTDVDRSEAAEILADMDAVHGSFLAYNASFVSTVRRGETYPYSDRLYDWAGGQNQATPFRPDPARYPADFMNAIREHAFAAIYTNGSDYLGDPAYRVIVESYQPVHVWNGTIGPDPALAPRWKSCLPRVKWLAKER